MERAEYAPESLKSGDDLGILSVSTSFKITKRNDFDEIKECDGLQSPRFVQRSIEVPANRQELLTESLLLIIASGVEIGTISRTRDSSEPMLAAAEAADRTG